MYQAPAAIWNEIERTQTLQTQFAARMFHLDDEELDKGLEAEAAELVAEGVSPALAASYLKVMPLLWENEAIANYLVDHPRAMAALPNVADVSEAVIVASNDYRMDESQKKQLAELLKAPPM